MNHEDGGVVGRIFRSSRVEEGKLSTGVIDNQVLEFRHDARKNFVGKLGQMGQS